MNPSFAPLGDRLAFRRALADATPGVLLILLALSYLDHVGGLGPLPILETWVSASGARVERVALWVVGLAAFASYPLGILVNCLGYFALESLVQGLAERSSGALGVAANVHARPQVSAWYARAPLRSPWPGDRASLPFKRYCFWVLQLLAEGLPGQQAVARALTVDAVTTMTRSSAFLLFVFAVLWSPSLLALLLAVAVAAYGVGTFELACRRPVSRASGPPSDAAVRAAARLLAGVLPVVLLRLGLELLLPAIGTHASVPAMLGLAGGALALVLVSALTASYTAFVALEQAALVCPEFFGRAHAARRARTLRGAPPPRTTTPAEALERLRARIDHLRAQAARTLP